MNKYNIDAKISKLKNEIDDLPKGTLAIKKAGDKEHYCLRWREGGNIREEYVAPADVPVLRRKIESRKKLEAQLEVLQEVLECPPAYQAPAAAPEYRCKVLLGDELAKFAAPVKPFKRRDVYPKLQDYLYNEKNPYTRERVFVLYGLRCTGKTTMMRQAAADMDGGAAARTAYIQIRGHDTFRDLDHDLIKLSRAGFQYIFVDEITKMSDFISGSAILADIYAASGMKIILAGNDSLGFVFAEGGELYDRCVNLHTTYISYSEFARVLGYNSIDTYLRFGGTMSGSGDGYNPPQEFAGARSAWKYTGAAIAENIQNSLRFYKRGGRFHSLWDLYNADMLTAAVNSVVEDMSRRFVLDVLAGPELVGLFADDRAAADRMAEVLQDKNLDGRAVTVSESQAAEIKDCLLALEVIAEVDVCSVSSRGGGFAKRTVITQPGLRYALAEALAETALDGLPEDWRAETRAWLTDGIKTRLLEDIVLYQTSLSHPDKKVLHARFPDGAAGMVIADPAARECSLFEIKYRGRSRRRLITDGEKCRMLEGVFGTIRERYVLYRGEAGTEEDGVRYVNVEDYQTRRKTPCFSYGNISRPTVCGYDIVDAIGRGTPESTLVDIA